MAPPTTIHLRAETKPFEARSPLTPTTARSLIEYGYILNVERSPTRIFKDEEFEAIGATLVEEGSWPTVPTDHLILGLKELDEDGHKPISHTHIQFAHCYKYQSGWEHVLGRFAKGGGTLLDLEFLVDPKTKIRKAAFGRSAGYTGAALSLLVWSFGLLHPNTPFPSASPYPNASSLIGEIKSALSQAQKHNPESPRVLIIGALGRCGAGATQLLLESGISESAITKWDIQETSTSPGPYKELLDVDIFINCIYVGKNEISPFITKDLLRDAGKDRRLTTICDISCDWNNPNNPVPIYDSNSTFMEPTTVVDDIGQDSSEIRLISIDHLPSLLPRESSEEYSNDLLPTLLQLDRRDQDPVWIGAEELFKEKVAELEKKDGGKGA